MPLLKYLADTNVVSDFRRPGSPVKDWLLDHRGQVGVSTVTLAELRRGVELRTGSARQQLETFYQFVLDDYREAIFVFDEAAAWEWGVLMAEARNQLPPVDDSFICAIARSCGLTVVTRNTKHFRGCPTVDPWQVAME